MSLLLLIQSVYFFPPEQAKKELYARKCLSSLLYSCNYHYHLHIFESMLICFHKILFKKGLYIIRKSMNVNSFSVLLFLQKQQCVIHDLELKNPTPQTSLYILTTFKIIYCIEILSIAYI
jgi:hypothetical protein